MKMTRRELDVKIALQGWQLRNQVFVYDSCEMRYRVWERDGKITGDDKMGDPTRDIAAAWLLIDCVLDPLQHAGLDDYADCRNRWRDYWDNPNVPRLHEITHPSKAARHISMAAYFAWTGERVEVEEGQDV